MRLICIFSTALLLLSVSPDLVVAQDSVDESGALPDAQPLDDSWTDQDGSDASSAALPTIQAATDFQSDVPDSEEAAVVQSSDYARLNNEARTPHPWRTLLELSATIGVGTTWYWVNEERQVADWDYPSWKEKLTFDTDIMIFDNNDFEVNYTWHTFAGGSSHLLGRSNGLSIAQSFGFGTLASVFWEYGIEARELISVNDLLITNTTGIPTGEFFHRLAQYLHQGQEGLGWDAARWTLGVGHTAHAALDGKSVAQDLHITPDFRWFYSLESASIARRDGDAMEETGSSLQHTVGFAGRIVALDDYLRPGRSQQWFGAANFTNFAISLSRGEGYATRAEASTLLAGWRHQNIPEDGGALGTTLNIATEVGYKYHREEYGLWRDRLGGLQAPGVAIEGELLSDTWKLRGEVHASFDLMGVNSLSWQQLRDQGDDEASKSILRNSGYYYGYGASSRVKASLEIDRFKLGAGLFVGRYASIEGFDRARESLEKEVSGDDDLLDYELFLRSKLYQQAYAQVRWGQSYRSGRLGEFHAQQSLERANFELGLQF